MYTDLNMIGRIILNVKLKGIWCEGADRITLGRDWWHILVNTVNKLQFHKRQWICFLGKQLSATERWYIMGLDIEVRNKEGIVVENRHLEYQGDGCISVWRKYIISYKVRILLVKANWPLSSLEIWSGPTLGARDWYPRQIIHLVLPTTKGRSEVRFWCLWCYSVFLYRNYNCSAACHSAPGSNGLCSLDDSPLPRFLLAHAVYGQVCSGIW